LKRRLDRSNAHFRKAVGRLPLGVSSNFRYWGDERTIYVARGEGAWLWDIDGNAYVDHRLGYGPAILGHANPLVDAAAQEGQRVGGVYALGTEMEYAVAERIARMVRGAELVRFSNSGTEAVMAALRLARGYTGKDGYVLLEVGYHGLFDSVMWAANLERIGPDGAPAVESYGRGVPNLIRQLFWQTPMNDAERIEDIFRADAHRIAALLVEPIMGNCCGIAADPQFLRDVRGLCDRYGVLLIVDEVKTGFRVARGGAQELYGVTGDLMTFAKAMGNGYPIAALAGREEVMRHLGRGVAHGGTYTAHAMSLAAANETLRILEETSALDDVAAYGTRLRAGIGRILERRGIAHAFAGHPSMSGLFFASTPPRTYRDWRTSDYTFYDALAQHLIDGGVLCEPDSREPWFVSAAHDEATLAHTLAVFEEAVDVTRATLERGARRPAALMTGIDAAE
jgi:glutamate-1-semialdehyde 2,1-aminomutase